VRGEDVRVADVGYEPLWLDLPDGLPQERFVEVLRSLGGIARGYQWWIGDALVYAESHYGDELAYQLAEELNLEPHTLTNYRWVASSVDRKRRRDDLSWSHHAEVARLGPKAQAEVLARAASEGWTVRQLRDHVAIVYPQSQPGLFNDDDGDQARVSENRRLESIERRFEADGQVDPDDVRWLLGVARRAIRS
jgi:hypothetical protein